MKLKLIAFLSLFAHSFSDVMRCMNFYGLETERAGFVCDWQHGPSWYLERLQKDLDINTIRLPFSYDYVKANNLINMDIFISECHRLNLNVILDYHRTSSSHQGPTPEESLSLQEFVDTWMTVLNRYYTIPEVMGVGIFNEIQLHEDFDYTVGMHREVMNQIEYYFPERFSFFVGCPDWGGNCSKMIFPHEQLTNRTYIEVHKYIFSGNSVEEDWDISIPYYIPPERWFIGETGWKHGDPKEREWAETFLAYLKKRGIYNVCAWTIAHSGDTEGWWKDDCQTFNWEKAALLKSLWYGGFKRLRGMKS